MSSSNGEIVSIKSDVEKDPIEGVSPAIVPPPSEAPALIVCELDTDAKKIIKVSNDRTENDFINFF